MKNNEPEPITYNHKQMHDAQLQVINWLIGRCEDQFVRAWLVQERKLVEGLGAAISEKGGAL